MRASYERALSLVDFVSRYTTDRLSGEMRRLTNCEALIPALVDVRLSSARSLLEREISRIPVLVSSRISQAGAKLDMTGRLLSALASRGSQRASERLDELTGRLITAADTAMKRNVARLDSLAGMIGALSPDNTLKRGYSITRVNGKAVTDASSLKKGERITTRLYHGEVESEVV